MRDTCSAPRRLMPAKATQKSMHDMARYTPSAYQPYDLMRILRRWDREGEGGPASSGFGEGDREARRAGKRWKNREFVDLGVLVSGLDGCTMTPKRDIVGSRGAATREENARDSIGTRKSRSMSKVDTGSKMKQQAVSE